MAKVFDFDDKSLAEWNAWVASRPRVIQELCQRLPPNLLYRLKSSGHRVMILSYSESGTVTVSVTGKYNRVTFDREVFGIKPEDLEECELPEEGEPLGTVFVDDVEVSAFIDAEIEARHQRGEQHNEERCRLCMRDKDDDREVD
jgi:hypothetical protein